MASTDGSLLDMDDLLLVVKVSKSTVYKLMALDEFPRPIKIGDRSLWKRSDIDHWIENQKPKA